VFSTIAQCGFINIILINWSTQTKVGTLRYYLFLFYKFLLTIMLAYILIGLVLSTQHGQSDKCTSVSGLKGMCSSENTYLTIQEVGLHACQKECSIRLKCAAINYRFDTLTCELLHSANTSLSSVSECVYMVKGQWQTVNIRILSIIFLHNY